MATRRSLSPPDGRTVWLVTWGRPARSDWAAVLVVAFDPDEAMAVATERFPDRWQPTTAVPAAAPVARAVLAGEPLPAQSRFEVLS
jgi:hypothetical protein